MERLTDKHFSGKGYYMICSGVCRCNGQCGDCEELEKVVDRLGEYEDKAEQKPMTNADRIRAMSDEELAENMSDWQWWGGGLDPKNWLEWLKHPAE